MKIVIRPIIVAALLLCLIVIVGTIGYSLIQKWDILDSLYMTIITIGTVGFHEVRYLSDSGRIFTIFLIISGISIGSYAIANLSAFLIEGHIRDFYKGRKMEKLISN